MGQSYWLLFVSTANDLQWNLNAETRNIFDLTKSCQPMKPYHIVNIIEERLVVIKRTQTRLLNKYMLIMSQIFHLIVGALALMLAVLHVIQELELIKSREYVKAIVMNGMMHAVMTIFITINEVFWRHALKQTLFAHNYHPSLQMELSCVSCRVMTFHMLPSVVMMEKKQNLKNHQVEMNGKDQL